MVIDLYAFSCENIVTPGCTLTDSQCTLIDCCTSSTATVVKCSICQRREQPPILNWFLFAFLADEAFVSFLLLVRLLTSRKDVYVFLWIATHLIYCHLLLRSPTYLSVFACIWIYCCAPLHISTYFQICLRVSMHVSAFIHMTTHYYVLAHVSFLS